MIHLYILRYNFHQRGVGALLKRLIDLGILPIRRKSPRGYKPHLSILFRSDGQHLFGIDTSRAHGTMDSHVFLITHAHSDHYGNSAMLSQKSVASEKTARALEIRYKRKFAGTTFKIGETINIDGVMVRTYPTGHTIGATAFSWENEIGTTILATGDVKDASHFPKCDVLITEANYGNPADPQCRFEEEIDLFEEAIEGDVAFGAYVFGKAQRAVELIRNFGYHDKIEMEHKTLELTRGLMDQVEPLVGLNGNEGGVIIVPPWDLCRLPKRFDKFVLSGQRRYRHQQIRISDHLDVDGLTEMVKKCNPDVTIIYHPNGNMPIKFAQHLDKNGFAAISLDDITNVIS